MAKKNDSKSKKKATSSKKKKAASAKNKKLSSSKAPSSKNKEPKTDMTPAPDKNQQSGEIKKKASRKNNKSISEGAASATTETVTPIPVTENGQTAQAEENKETAIPVSEEKNETTVTVSSPETSSEIKKPWGAGSEEDVLSSTTATEKVVAQKKSESYKVIDLTEQELETSQETVNKDHPLADLQANLPIVLANWTGFGDATEEIVRETIHRSHPKIDYKISFERNPLMPMREAAVIVEEIFPGGNAKIRIPQRGYLTIVP